MTYIKDQSVIANDMLLPIADFNNIADESRLFNMEDQMNEALEGAILLVENQINNLMSIFELFINKNKQLFNSVKR